MSEPQVERELKRDSFGRVELVHVGAERFIRRVAAPRNVVVRALARLLMRRERRALEVLQGMLGVPQFVERRDVRDSASRDGKVPPAEAVLVRSYIAGAPLHRAETIPFDFFEQLEALVRAAHARGVCHNDLHKEQNILVTQEGYPALIDFQLASVHRLPARGPWQRRKYTLRVRDDLRHITKHRRRYTRDGRGPASLAVSDSERARHKRSPLAHTWRRLGKPLYEWLTRRVLKRRDGEERRPSRGPWPQWTPVQRATRTWDPHAS